MHAKPTRVGLSDPVNMAINKYSNHSIIIAIKTNCITDIKQSLYKVLMRIRLLQVIEYQH